MSGRHKLIDSRWAGCVQQLIIGAGIKVFGQEAAPIGSGKDVRYASSHQLFAQRRVIQALGLLDETCQVVDPFPIGRCALIVKHARQCHLMLGQ